MSKASAGKQPVVVRGLKVYERKDGSILVGPPNLKQYATYDDGKQWVPDLMILAREEKDGLITITVPQWFAERKGFNYDR